MGTTQSVPLDHRRKPHANTLPPRTKLTKPRTNSVTARDHPYKNRFSVSQRRSGLPDVVHHLGLEFELLGGEDARGNRSSLIATTTLPIYADVGTNAGFLDPAVMWVGGNDPPSAFAGNTARRSRANSIAGSFTVCNECERTAPAIGTVRRRSQLLAAPPATATRRTKCQSLTMDYVDYFSQQSYAPPVELDAGLPVELDAGRCTSPSGYSVIGAFKRGSLRIVNGAASPTPSSAPASPRIVAHQQPSGPSSVPYCQGSNLRPTRGLHRVRSLESMTPLRGVRLVPSSPKPPGQDSEDTVPGSPFSFIQGSTSGPDADTIPGLDLGNGMEYPDSDFHETNFFDAFERLPVYNDDDDDEPVAPPEQLPEPEQVDEDFFPAPQHDPQIGLRRPCLQDCNRYSGTDSGYSSTGSVNSRTTRSERKHDGSSIMMEEATCSEKVSEEYENVEAVEKGIRRRKSMAKSMVAAIKRRCSYGDLKAVRKKESVPELPTSKPTIKAKKSRSLLRRRKSKSSIAVDQGPALGVQSSLPDIESVPPLPPTYVNREFLGHFVVPVSRDQDAHGFPENPRAPPKRRATIDGNERQRDYQAPVGTQSFPRRGSKITGQEYYQRFSMVKAVS